MKIVINTEIGLFGVPKYLVKELVDAGNVEAAAELKIFEEDELLSQHDLPLTFVKRTNPHLIALVEKYERDLPHLKIIEIPGDIETYVFANEMGIESVHEAHRVWS